MSKFLPFLSVKFSRRTLLKSLMGVGALSMFGATLASKSARAQTKVPKSVVQYRDRPNGNQRCDNCALFLPPNACKNVEGVISPRGWCSIWVKR